MSMATMSIGAPVITFYSFPFGRVGWVLLLAHFTLVTPLCHISTHPGPVVSLLELQSNSSWSEVSGEWAAMSVFNQPAANG